MCITHPQYRSRLLTLLPDMATKESPTEESPTEYFVYSKKAAKVSGVFLSVCGVEYTMLTSIADWRSCYFWNDAKLVGTNLKYSKYTPSKDGYDLRKDT